MTDPYIGTPTLVSGVTYTPAIGDVVIDSNSDAEYVCISVSGTTYTWERLGRDGSLALSGEVIHKSILAAAGDMIYASAANTPAALSIGNSNQVLRVSNGGLPSWGDDLAKQSVDNNGDWRKVILSGGNDSNTWDADATAQTSEVYQSKYVSVQSGTGTLRATILRGGAISISSNSINYDGTRVTDNAMITFLDNTATNAIGNGIKIGGGGAVFIGAGDASNGSSVSAASETLYLFADSSIYVEAGGNTASNRTGFEITTSGHVLPIKAENGTNNVQNLGASGNAWGTVYANSFIGDLTGNVTGNVTGNLTGNADSATKATKDGDDNVISTTYLKLSGGTLTGNLLGTSTASIGNADHPFHNLVLGGTTNDTMTASSANPRITFQEGTGTEPVHLIYTDKDTYRTLAGLKVIGGTNATPAWFEVEGQVYAAGFNGPLSGNVTGNLTGNVTGNVTGDVTGDLTGTASKATADADGNTISSTYLKLSGGTMSGTISRYYSSASSDPMISLSSNDQTVNLFKVGHGTSTTISSAAYALQYVGANNAPNNYLQILANATSNSSSVALRIDENGTTYFPTGFNYSGIQSGSYDVARVIWFADSDGVGIPVYDNDFKYNPSSNTISIGAGTLSATQYSGNAATATDATNATNDSDGNPINTTYIKRISSSTDNAIVRFDGTTGAVQNSGITISDTTNILDTPGGIHIRGHIDASANSGGGYHKSYNNIVLHGDDTYGTSGILFISDKGSTSIGHPSDRGFIQFHAHGVSAYAAEGTAPTLATSGESNQLIIGVGNDNADQIRLQTPSRTGLLHQIGANGYVIPDTNNTNGTVGSNVGPVYVNGGAITACTPYAEASVLAATNDSLGNAIHTTYIKEVAWDSTNNKLTKTINTTTTDIATSYELKKGIDDVETIIGTQVYSSGTPSTGTWTGTSSTITGLYTGLRINYYLPMPGNGNATLNLTLSSGSTTGAIDCYYDADTRLSTQYKAGSIIPLTYFASGSVTVNGTSIASNRWIADGNYYYDTNDQAGHIRYFQDTAYMKPTTALYRYQLLFSKGDGAHLIPANTTSNSTANSKSTITTAAFNVFEPIYYYSYTNTVSAEGNINGQYFWQMKSDVNLQYSFNTGSTLTAYKDVYLVASLEADGITAKLRNPGATGTNASAAATGSNAGPITQTLPSTEDGYIYIKLGHAYSTTNIILTLDHPIYWYKSGAVRKYTGQSGDIIIDCGTLGASSTTAEQTISKTISDTRITSNMTVIHGEFGDPNAFEEKVTCTSSNGSITIATKLYAGKTSTLTLTISPTS